MKAIRWAKLFAYLGFVLGAIAAVPTLIGMFILPAMSPVVPALLAFLIGPLAIACLVMAAIFWGVDRARR